MSYEKKLAAHSRRNRKIDEVDYWRLDITFHRDTETAQSWYICTTTSMMGTVNGSVS